MLQFRRMQATPHILSPVSEHEDGRKYEPLVAGGCRTTACGKVQDPDTRHIDGTLEFPRTPLLRMPDRVLYVQEEVE